MPETELRSETSIATACRELQQAWRDITYVSQQYHGRAVLFARRGDKRARRGNPRSFLTNVVFEGRWAGVID